MSNSLLSRAGQLIRTKLNTRSINVSRVRAGVVDSNEPQVAKCYDRIKPLQKRFQTDDGVPVHLKAGARDYILYYASIGFTALGLLGSLEFFYSQAFPKK